MSVVQRINCQPQVSSYEEIKMLSEKDKKYVTIWFFQQTRKDLKIYQERKKEKWLALSLHKTTDYEDKEWSVEHSGEWKKEKLTVGKKWHQEKKERKINGRWNMASEKERDIYVYIYI